VRSHQNPTCNSFEHFQFKIILKLNKRTPNKLEVGFWRDPVCTSIGSRDEKIDFRSESFSGLHSRFDLGWLTREGFVDRGKELWGRTCEGSTPVQRWNYKILN
jgi:hypothetical protein